MTITVQDALLTLATMAAATLVLIRMGGLVNRAKQGGIPQQVLWPIIGLGTAALLLVLAPWWWGEPYGWRDAIFSGAAAWYVWRDRRWRCTPLEHRRSGAG